MNTICTAVAVAIVASTVPAAAIDMDQWPEVASDAQGNLQIKAPAIFINNILFNPADLASKDDLADAVEPLKATQQMLATTLELLKTAQATASTLQADLKTSQQALMFVLEQVVPANAEVPVGCQVSTWSTWTKCSQTCGKGDRTRTRTSKTFPGIAGVSCPASSERETCEIKKCAVDCEVGDWSEFAGCMPSCGPNSKQCKHRTVVTPAAYGGGACGTTYECRNCNTTCPEGACAGGVFRHVDELKVLKDCTLVAGSVELVNVDATAETDNAVIASYTSKIEEVTGNINLFNVEGLTSLEMFASVVTVGGNFKLSHLLNLVSIAGTTSLTTVGGDFKLSHLLNLVSVAGATALTTVGGDFKLSHLLKLDAIEGFHHLEEIGGVFYVANLPSVKEINAFNRLKLVVKDLQIHNAAAAGDKAAEGSALTLVNAFAALVEIGGGLSLSSLFRVTSFKPFKALTNVGSSIYMIYMNALPPRDLVLMFPKLKIVKRGNIDLSKMSYGPFNTDDSESIFPELEEVGGTHNGKIILEEGKFDLRGGFPKLLKVAMIRFYQVAFPAASSPFASLEEVLPYGLHTGSISMISINSCPTSVDLEQCMQSFEGWFPNLKKVDRSVVLVDSDAVTGFLGFNNLKSVKSITFRGLQKLAICKSKIEHLRQISNSFSSVDIGVELDC